MVWSRPSLIVALSCLWFSSLAQVNRYMVFFKDKAGTTYSLNSPAEFLSTPAIQRRISQGIVVTQADLPVNENYVKGVRESGANTFFTTRWMNGVLVQCDAALISSIENLAYVDHVEFVAPNERLLVDGRKGSPLKKKALVPSLSVLKPGKCNITLEGS